MTEHSAEAIAAYPDDVNFAPVELALFRTGFDRCLEATRAAAHAQAVADVAVAQYSAAMPVLSGTPVDEEAIRAVLSGFWGKGEVAGLSHALAPLFAQVAAQQREADARIAEQARNAHFSDPNDVIRFTAAAIRSTDSTLTADLPRPEGDNQ